jgi:hypothetical protein
LFCRLRDGHAGALRGGFHLALLVLHALRPQVAAERAGCRADHRARADGTAIAAGGRADGTAPPNAPMPAPMPVLRCVSVIPPAQPDRTMAVATVASTNFFMAIPF